MVGPLREGEVSVAVAYVVKLEMPRDVDDDKDDAIGADDEELEEDLVGLVNDHRLCERNQVAFMCFQLVHRIPLLGYSALQYNAIQYNTIQYNTIQYNKIQYNTIQYNTIQYNTIQ